MKRYFFFAFILCVSFSCKASAQYCPDELGAFIGSAAEKIASKEFNRQHIIALNARLREFAQGSMPRIEIENRIINIRKTPLIAAPPLIFTEAEQGDVGALVAGIHNDQVEIIEVFQILDSDSFLAHLALWQNGKVLYFRNTDDSLKSIVRIDKGNHGFREGQLVPIVTWQGENVCQVADLTFPLRVELGVFYIFRYEGIYAYDSQDGQKKVGRFTEVVESQWNGMVDLAQALKTDGTIRSVENGVIADPLAEQLSNPQSEDKTTQRNAIDIRENETRLWKSSSGESSVSAQYISRDGKGNAMLRRSTDKKAISVRISQLSAADRAYIYGFPETETLFDFPVLDETLIGNGGYTVLSFDIDKIHEHCFDSLSSELFSPELKILEGITVNRDWDTLAGKLTGHICAILPYDSSESKQRIVCVLLTQDGSRISLLFDQFAKDDRKAILDFLRMHDFFALVGYVNRLSVDEVAMSTLQNIPFSPSERQTILATMLAHEDQLAGVQRTISLSARPDPVSAKENKEVNRILVEFHRKHEGAPYRSVATVLVDFPFISKLYHGWLKKLDEGMTIDNLEEFVSSTYAHPELLRLHRDSMARRYLKSLMADTSLEPISSSGEPEALSADIPKEGSRRAFQASIEATASSLDLLHMASAPLTAAQAKELQSQVASRLSLPIEFENALGMRFVLIPPGSFEMGSSEEEVQNRIALIDRHIGLDAFRKIKTYLAASASPKRTIVISKPFYLCVNETTVRDFELAINGKNINSTVPACVSWRDAERFCLSISGSDQSSGAQKYRLPTEAEWEYACRAGTKGLHFFESAEGMAEYAALQMPEAQSVIGSRKANPWGLFDMYGNVWELCSDEFNHNSFFASAVKGESILKVIKGGGWRDLDFTAYSAARGCSSDRPSDTVGFRVLLEIPVEAD